MIIRRKVYILSAFVVRIEPVYWTKIEQGKIILNETVNMISTEYQAI